VISVNFTTERIRHCSKKSQLLKLMTQTKQKTTTIMTNNMFKKVMVAGGVMALALTAVAPGLSTYAESTSGGFEITGGGLTLRFVDVLDYNSKTGATPTNSTFPSVAAANYSFGTGASQLLDSQRVSLAATPGVELYTNGVLSTADATVRTKPVVASTTTQVNGSFVLGVQNLSTSGFKLSAKMTNFSKSGVVLPLCRTIACAITADKWFGIQGLAAKASNSPDYLGQAVGTPAADQISELQPSAITDLTATGASAQVTAGTDPIFTSQPLITSTDFDNLLNFTAGTGQGEFYKKMQLNYKIPANTPAGVYNATLTVTANSI
jgi:hypothetical protein